MGSFRAGWMATITSDFCFFRPGVLAELATVFFSRRGDANAGYVCALLGFRARHDNPPLNLRTTHGTLRGVSIARIRAVAVDETKTCTRELRLPILPFLANMRKPRLRSAAKSSPSPAMWMNHVGQPSLRLRSRQGSRLSGRAKLGSAEPLTGEYPYCYGQERNRIPKADR
jgi:hypothetical protein